MKRHAWNLAAFAWGFAEGTLFFIVPDVLLSFVGLKRGAQAAAAASIFAAVGAACGGALIYLWSLHNFSAAHDAVLAVPAISDTMASRAFVAMDEQGWLWATFTGPLSSTPYKVYALWAPQIGAPLMTFVAASVLARLPRFVIAGVGAAFVGRWLAPRVGATRLAWALALAWVFFYAAFFMLMPG